MASTATTHLGRRAFARSRVDGAVVALVLAGVTVLAALVFVVAAGIVAPAALVADDALRDSVLGFAGASVPTRTLIASGAAIVGVASGALLVSRLRSGGVPGSYHIVTADEDGVLLVDRDGMARIAEVAAMRAPGVLAADARIQGSQRGPVRARLRLTVAGGGDLKAAGEQARRHARRAIEQLVGVEVTDVVVAVDVASTDYFERGLV